MDQVVEHLSLKYKPLSSNPNTATTNKQKGPIYMRLDFFYLSNL
jgi:hypothetical protein